MVVWSLRLLTKINSVHEFDLLTTMSRDDMLVDRRVLAATRERLLVLRYYAQLIECSSYPMSDAWLAFIGRA